MRRGITIPRLPHGPIRRCPHGARRGPLQEKLLVESGKPALVLPQIRPIGDLDEDVLEAQRPYVGLPDAISDIGREFSLMALIDDWVREHPQLRLAQELAEAPQQTQSLAASSADLIDVMETEEISFDRLPEAYLIDLAVHREAILSLFDLMSKKLPALLMSENSHGGKGTAQPPHSPGSQEAH